MKRLTINLTDSPRDQKIAKYVANQVAFTGESVSTIINAMLYEWIISHEGDTTNPSPIAIKRPVVSNTTEPLPLEIEAETDDPNNLFGALNHEN